MTTNEEWKKRWDKECMNDKIDKELVHYVVGSLNNRIKELKGLLEKAREEIIAYCPQDEIRFKLLTEIEKACGIKEAEKA